MTPEELKLQGAEAILQALFESHTSKDGGYSMGRCVERFRELTGVKGLSEFTRLQTSGLLTLNNAIIPDE